MKRILCLFFGHRWKNYGGNWNKSMNLGHLHPLAGAIELCLRCGRVWDDFGYILINEEEGRAYHKKKLEQLRSDAQKLKLKLIGDA